MLSHTTTACRTWKVQFGSLQKSLTFVDRKRLQERRPFHNRHCVDVTFSIKCSDFLDGGYVVSEENGIDVLNVNRSVHDGTNDPAVPEHSGVCQRRRVCVFRLYSVAQLRKCSRIRGRGGVVEAHGVAWCDQSAGVWRAPWRDQRFAPGEHNETLTTKKQSSYRQVTAVHGHYFVNARRQEA